MTTEAPPTDLSPFVRSNAQAIVAGYGHLTWRLELATLAQLNHGVDPRAVPAEALRVQKTHPVIYVADKTVTGMIRRPDLFSVVHDDPAIVAEVEAWMWPLLDEILAAAARGFSYGAVAVVFDVERDDLVLEVPTKDGEKTRKKTVVRFTRFSDAFEAHPDNTQVECAPNGKWQALVVDGKRYDRSRCHLWSWDPEFGEVCGQGALRRSWRAWCEDQILALLETKYLERSVDSPRKVRAPSGPVTTADGTTSAIEHTMAIASGLRGGGVAGLPSERDENGNPHYDIEAMDLPDRSNVWFRARDRRGKEMMLAFLAAPSLSGLDDTGDAKTLDGLLRDYVEQLATWCATGLTRIAGLVHTANHDPKKDLPPEIVATDVGKTAAKKMLKELLAMANQQPAGEVAQVLDVPTVLDRLGAPVRAPEDAPAPMEPPAGPVASTGPGGGQEPPGPDKDGTAEREDRRERAKTDAGEEDTGMPRDGDEG